MNNVILKEIEKIENIINEKYNLIEDYKKRISTTDFSTSWYLSTIKNYIEYIELQEKEINNLKCYKNSLKNLIEEMEK